MDSISVDFIAIDEDWDKEISNYHFDIYHLSGWINASAVIEDGKPLGIVAQYNNKKIFLPIMVRKINADYWDATSTYGYGGPIDDDLLTDDQLDIMIKKIKIFLFNEGCVSLFMRLHPVINKGRNPNIGNTLTHGLTLASDLTKSEDEHWNETQNQHRRGIKKALKVGITTRVEELTEENAKVFSNIYTETMSKVKADDYYFFSNEYYYDMSKNLQGRLLLITAYEGDKAIASSLYTLCKESGIMQYHLGGTLNDYRKLQPSKLITHIARNWGRENNYKLLHLGGGLGSKLDSLYNYKKGFSSQELSFRTYRLVVNPEEYEKLVADIGLSVDDLNSEFFPLYRKKVSQFLEEVSEEVNLEEDFERLV